MRSTVLVYIGLIMMVLQIAILANVTAKSSYSDVLQASVDDALERTMHMTRMDADLHFDKTVWGTDATGSESNKPLGIGETSFDQHSSGSAGNSLGAFKSRFVNTLMGNLDPRITDCTVNIYGADEETGVLSVEVIAHYKYLGRGTGTVKSYKTMIVNKTVRD